jgi:hypothetical protein
MESRLHGATEAITTGQQYLLTGREFNSPQMIGAPPVTAIVAPEI